ncbi:three-Cys-motif partner protein TcmP [Amycolatopsis sp. RTGN1]|uniref:three-Cys-motif partner protein TcmP n=1 Tax=Amycolatopsis ponsaeliensis TaxID=2992142 RepID=UPI00254F3332|nr:three-Cys-motif partner protein TcmP [Amycolatopsis sp. RTGN1]
MSSNKNFFLSPQAAAVYKHKLLKSYTPAWAGKVGSTSVNNKIVVYDAYSGPGRYEDENPGSPELLVDTAVAMASLRSVYSVFSEKEQDYCDKLSELLKSKAVDPSTYEVLQGPVEKHVDDVLAKTDGLPLLVFLDPYGLTIPFERVVHVLTSRDRPATPSFQQPKTELLMNFSYEAVRRISGVVRSEKEYPAKEGQIRALNEALGGDWWQEIARNENEGWVQEVLHGYANRVCRAANYGTITANVADSLEAQPVYELILFTRHWDGLWEMARSMSMARQEWRQWLASRREEATGGQEELRGLSFDDNKEAWIDEIATNIESILSSQPGFVIESKLGELLGRTLGLARETHIRSALKILKTRNIIKTVPTGKLQRAYVERA